MREDQFSTVLGPRRGPDARDTLHSSHPRVFAKAQLERLLNDLKAGELSEPLQALAQADAAGKLHAPLMRQLRSETLDSLVEIGAKAWEQTLGTVLALTYVHDPYPSDLCIDIDRIVHVRARHWSFDLDDEFTAACGERLTAVDISNEDLRRGIWRDAEFFGYQQCRGCAQNGASPAMSDIADNGILPGGVLADVSTAAYRALSRNEPLPVQPQKARELGIDVYRALALQHIAAAAAKRTEAIILEDLHWARQVAFTASRSPNDMGGAPLPGPSPEELDELSDEPEAIHARFLTIARKAATVISEADWLTDLDQLLPVEPVPPAETASYPWYAERAFHLSRLWRLLRDRGVSVPSALV